MSFWKEIQRRKVVKVGIAYAVAAWLIIHPVDIVFPILHLPEWSITLVAALLIIAFPFVLLFSWVYEITPKGLKKTKDVPLSKSTTQLTGRKLNYIIIGLLVVTVALLVFDNFYLNQRAVETKLIPITAGVEKDKKTIAVLPFVDLSPNSDQGYFVDGLSEELLNALTKISDLRVTSRTSSFTFKGSNKKIQEIADELGVENILEGSVRKAGDALRITAQLVRAKDDYHLWSETYDRELKDIFVVQEEIAMAVADELKASLGIESIHSILGGTESVQAYELYLVAKGQSNESKYSLALKSIDAAIALDPNFALAWAAKSNIHVYLSIFGPTSSAAAEQNVAQSSALKAIELEPDLVTGYIVLGSIKFLRRDFIEARSAYSKALELKTEPLSGDEYQLGIYYQELGYFKKANELFEEMRQNDPLNRDVRDEYVMNIAFLGDTKRAIEEYERGSALFGDHWC